MKTARFHPARLTPALCVAFGLAASRGSADWAPNGNRIDPTSISSSRPQVAADNFGGLLVGYAFSQVYSRLLPSGEIAAGWPVVASESFGYASSPVPDGLAGAYAVIARPGLVTVRHFLSDGTPDPAWPGSGLDVCSAAGYKYAQAGSDWAGGAFVIWADGRNADASTGGFPRELYGTRVLPDGSIAPGWDPQGTLIAAAAESVVIRLGPVRPDGVEGAYVNIEHVRHILTPDEQVEPFLVHMGPEGTPPTGWPSGGWPPPELGLAYPFGYEPDGTGGAYIAWVQPQGGTFGSRLLRILGSGEITPGWPAGGVPALEDTTRLYFVKTLAADGTGGVFAGVAADTGGGWPPSVNRVLHFDAAGDPVSYWPAGGRRVPQPPDTSPYSYSPLLLASDANGGVFVVWAQSADVNGYFATIGAIHLNALGEPVAGWPEGGLPVCDTPGQRKDIQIVSGGSGATYVVWNDHRPPDPESQFFAYASRLDIFDAPVVAVEHAGLSPTTLRAAPNPFVEAVDLRLTLAEAGAVRLDVLDVGGRIVRRVASGWLAAGAHTRRWDGRTDAGSEAPSGLYFVRGTIGGREFGARLVRIR